MGRLFPGILNVVPTIPSKASSGEQKAPHEEWSMNTRYPKHTGWRQVPLSAPDANGATCRFVRESAGLGQKLVLWKVERIGDMPELPAVEPDTDKQKLLDWDFNLSVPILMPDGQSLRYIISGFYLYGLDRPADPVTGLPMGHALTDTTSPAQSVVKTGDFQPVF